jgi:hypothetical protein
MAKTNRTESPFPRYKLGKTKARPGAVKFKLAKYAIKAELPTPPKVFGDQDLVTASWQVLGNDNYGDCVWAGAAHETMLWNKEANRVVSFTAKGVLSDYSKVTGFDPRDPEDTDKGTDMQVAASYRRKTGVLDARGKRHKIAAYLALKPGDVNELVLAMYLFGAVGIGIRFPDSAMTQFHQRKPWSVVPGPTPRDGHYIPGFGRDKKGNLVVVTWGRIQLMTPQFYKKYCDEVVAYISAEALTKGASRNGLKIDQLKADLRALG